METPEQYTVKTPEDEFNEIIDRIETRAMACDGPVTPTLQEATEAELSRLWELVNEISPKRKAIARRILQGKETDQDTNDYLIANGLDPDVVGKTGALFVKAVCENITLKEENKLYREALADISASRKAGKYVINIAVTALSKFQPKKDENQIHTREAI